MTENNAAQPVLTDAEILHLATLFGIGTLPVLSGSYQSQIPEGERLARFARAIGSALLSKLRAPVADESPMAKMADALREKARQEQQAYQDRRNQATEWGSIPEGTEADSAHVADERELPTLPVAWGSAINDAGDDHVDLYSAEQMQEYARAALASAPVAGEAAERLDAPAQVGGTRFGKGIHWSTVIQAAQRYHQYMQDPAREAERIAQAKKFQALVAGDSAPQVGPVAGEAQESIEQMAVNRYRPVPDGKFSYKVVAGDGSRSLYTGTKDSCLRVAAKLTEAFLDGAFVASYAAPQASEAVREVAGVTLDGCLETLFRVGEHLGINYAESRKQPGAPSGVYIKAIEDRVSQARDTALEEAAKLMERTSRGTGATLIRVSLSAQPDAEPLSNPKQFALTGTENIRAGAPYDNPAFEALCREHGIWGTAQSALCAVFWRQAGQQRADATDWSAIAAEAQVERDAARAERDALIVESQQHAAGDERAAFEAAYQADYDDPGAACEREHFGKGYRAGLAAQSGAIRNPLIADSKQHNDGADCE